jgi:hypothetical protein
MDALDRRLRAIYDALDARNYKSALKLCIAAGEKHPKNDLIKTLQALALARSGKAAEAGKVCPCLLVDSSRVVTPWLSIIVCSHACADLR